MEVVVHAGLAHADGGEIPAGRVGRADAVVDHRRPLVAAVVVAVVVDVELVHHHRGLHRVVMIGRGGADLAVDREVVGEAVLAGQGELLEHRGPFVVAVFRAHVHVVEAAVQQAAGGGIDVAVLDDGLGLAGEGAAIGQLGHVAAEGDGFDIVLVALGVDLGIHRIQGEQGVGAGLPLQ